MAAQLGDEDMARNDSSDLLMTKIGQQMRPQQGFPREMQPKGKSATNLRKVNTEMSQPTNLRKANIEMSQLLKHEINVSKETVERVKRGHSIFDLDIVQEA